MGTLRQVTRARNAWRLLFALVLAAGFLVRPHSAVPAFAASVFFNGYGGDASATYGANATVQISGDLSGGCVDLFGAYKANVYVVPHGSVNPAAKTAMSGTPNDVIVTDFTDGLYDSETIGYTAPSGKLGTGDYDIILDTCADGSYDPGTADLDYGSSAPHGAFTVSLPTTLPPISDAIKEEKASAEEQASGLAALGASFKALELAEQMAEYAECVEGVLELDPECLTEILDKYAFKKGFNAFYPGFAAQAEADMEAVKSHYEAIANDPPDPTYRQITTLPAVQPITATTNDPLDGAGVGMGNAAANEDALAQALLHAIERYQGAAAASDGTWGLIQARAIRDYAGDLAAQLAQSDAALNNDSAALKADTRPLDTALSNLETFRARLASSGFTADELLALHNAGLSDTVIGQFKTDFTVLTFASVSKADQESNIANLVAANTTAISSLQSTVTAMNTIISTLATTSTVVDAAPVANAGGPYSGTAGTPITFSGSATSSSSITKYEWDLHGAGTFTDGTGQSVTAAYNRAGQTLIGLRVTNADGFINVAYARVTVSDPNTPPQLGSFSPAGFSVSVPPGSSQVFRVAASDADGDSVSTQWQLDGTAAGTGSSFTFSATLAQIGPHEVTVVATDNSPLGGSVQQSWSVDVPKLATTLAVAAAGGTAGGTATLSATLTQGGTPLAGKTITFTLNGQGFSGNTATTDSNGKATLTGVSLAGIAAGSYASGVGASFAGDTNDAGINASGTLTVAAATTLASIAVTPANPSIAKGTTQQYKATGTYSDHSTADITSGVTWASGTTGVATVTTGGLATGVAQGTSVISAALGSVSGNTTLTVTPATLVRIAVTPANASIAKGTTQQFKATGVYTDSSTADLTSSVTWSSGTTATATISTSGLASAVAQGTSTITAKSGSVSGGTMLTVTGPALVSVAITPANPTIAKGTTQQFTATGTYSDSSTADLTGSVTWGSSNTGVATVTSHGLATGSGAGTATIKASSGSVGGSTTLTVTPPALVSVAVSPANLTTYVGAGNPYKATGTYADHSTADLTSKVAWVSSNPTAATITTAGAATGVAAGTTTITATIGSIGANADLTVVAAPAGGAIPPLYVTERWNKGLAKVVVSASGSATVTPNVITGLPASGPDSLVFDHHGNLLASNPDAWTISLVNPSTGQIIKPAVNTSRIPTVADLTLDPNADVVWGIGWSNSAVARVDETTGVTTLLNPNHVGNLGGITFNGDGSRLFVSSHNGWIYELSPSDGHLVRSLRVPGGPDGMTDDPTTGRIFASGCGGLCDLAIGTDAQPTLTLVKVHTAVDGDGISADGQGHVYVINGSCCLRRLDLIKEAATSIATGIPSADDVAPLVGAGAPPPVLTSAAAGGVYGGVAALSATLTDSGQPVAGKTVSFTLDGKSFANNSAVTDGNGVATLHDVSLVGINVGSDPGGVGASFAGDATYPATSGSAALTITPAATTTTPANASVQAGAASVQLTAKVLASSPSTATVGEGSVRFALSETGSPIATPVSANVAAGSATVSFPVGGLAAGSYTVTASYSDASSPANFQASSGTATLTGSQTPPVTSASISPSANGAGWNNGDVIVTLSATDDGGPGVKQITYSATGAQPMASTTVPGASASIGITIEGGTTISYAATDNFGDRESPKTVTVHLDETPPSIAITGVREGGTYTNSAAATVAITDALSGVDPTLTAITLNGQPYLGGTAITAAGAYTLVVHVVDKAGNPASQTDHFRVQHATALAYVGDPKADYDDPATFAATLTDTAVTPPAAVSGVALTLGLGAQTCAATTDGTGKGSCGLTPNEVAGTYPLSASFAGNDLYLPSSAPAGTFTVTKEETALAITSSPTLAVGTVTVKAVLTEDGQIPIAGRTVTFSAGGVSATGTTDATGLAGATLPLAPGKDSLTASFGGDGDYASASAAAQTLYVYQPTRFVIWGGNPPVPAGQPANVAVGRDYVFWGSQWAKQVTGGDFQANSSFKGYADTVSGVTWTSKPGNSSDPPASVASYIGVIVATQATKQGGTLGGDVAEVVVLQVDSPAAYQPDPGHTGSGVVVVVVQ